MPISIRIPISPPCCCCPGLALSFTALVPSRSKEGRGQGGSLGDQLSWPEGTTGIDTHRNRGHRSIPIQWLIPTRGTSGSSETVCPVDVSCSPEPPDRPPRAQLTVSQCLGWCCTASCCAAEKEIEHVPHQSTKPVSICGAEMRERCCPPDRSSAHFVCGRGAQWAKS